MDARRLKIPLHWARWRVRRSQQRGRFGGLQAPILFGNSFPKSGTHLLTQVLLGFSRLGPVVESSVSAITMYDGFTGLERSHETIMSEVYRLQSGDVGYGHLHALPDMLAALCRDGVAPIFLYRDPRDVVVSHAFYLTDIEKNHVHHQYYSKELTSDDERLRVSILGRPELENISFPDISQRFVPFLKWLEQPEVLILRFEDFIAQRKETIVKIYDHVISRGFPYNRSRDKALEILESAIDPSRSPTFRSGKIGGWKDYFKDAHKDLFKQVAGKMLVDLGYEKDMDW